MWGVRMGVEMDRTVCFDVLVVGKVLVWEDIEV